MGVCMCIVCGLGNEFFSVLGVGAMYLWLCGIVYGNIICGFVLAVRFELVCIFVLHPSLGEWDINFLLGAARNAVTIFIFFFFLNINIYIYI